MKQVYEYCGLETDLAVGEMSRVNKGTTYLDFEKFDYWRPLFGSKFKVAELKTKLGTGTKELCLVDPNCKSLEEFEYKLYYKLYLLGVTKILWRLRPRFDSIDKQYGAVGAFIISEGSHLSEPPKKGWFKKNVLSIITWFQG